MSPCFSRNMFLFFDQELGTLILIKLGIDRNGLSVASTTMSVTSRQSSVIPLVELEHDLIIVGRAIHSRIIYIPISCACSTSTVYQISTALTNLAKHPRPQHFYGLRWIKFSFSIAKWLHERSSSGFVSGTVITYNFTHPFTRMFFCYTFEIHTSCCCIHQASELIPVSATVSISFWNRQK